MFLSEGPKRQKINKSRAKSCIMYASVKEHTVVPGCLLSQVAVIQEGMLVGMTEICHDKNHQSSMFITHDFFSFLFCVWFLFISHNATVNDNLSCKNIYYDVSVEIDMCMVCKHFRHILNGVPFLYIFIAYNICLHKSSAIPREEIWKVNEAREEIWKVRRKICKVNYAKISQLLPQFTLIVQYEHLHCKVWLLWDIYI